MKKKFSDAKDRVASAAKKPIALVSKPFKKKTETSGRITTDTLAEHRERVLAGGRRFKYPLQYARHRLVFNTIINAIAVLVSLVALVGWQLYKADNTSDFMYRVTRIVPLPVASVDGQPVRYSDYLMRLRSSVHYLEEKEQVSLRTPDGLARLDQVKRQEMNNVIADAYAVKLADEKGITVPDSELQLFLKQQRTSLSGEMSEATYNTVILDYYAWSPAEYEHAMYSKLLRQKVSYAVDDQATEAINSALSQTKNGNANLQAIAEALNKASANTAVFANSGLVPKDNQDGGLTAAAVKLDKNAISGIITPSTGDGYYLVKLVDSGDSVVSYDYIHIPLQTFEKLLVDLKADDKINEYIKVPSLPGE